LINLYPKKFIIFLFFSVLKGPFKLKQIIEHTLKVLTLWLLFGVLKMVADLVVVVVVVVVEIAVNEISH
jgi:hypothetical protein